MEALISQSTICNKRPHFPISFFLFNFPSLSRENRNLPGKWPNRLRVPRLSFSRPNYASESANYGGWDDPGLDSYDSGEELRRFLSSAGIDDRKQIFTFVLGLLCALAISKVRVSSIVVFPASVLVFAVGFSFGIVRSGGIGELNFGGKNRNKRSKEEAFRAYREKFRNLVQIVDDFDVNVDNLKCKIQKAIDSREVTLSDLEDYTKDLDCIGLSASNARNVIEASAEDSGCSSAVLVENQKPSRRKKELSGVAFDFLQSFGGLFRENANDPKQVKAKNVVKREAVEEGSVDNRSLNDNLIPSLSIDEEPLNPVGTSRVKANEVLSRDSMNDLPFDENGDRRVENRRMTREGIDDGRNRTSFDGNQKNRTRFLNNRRASLNMGNDSLTETWGSQDNVVESVNFSVRTKHTETETSFVREQKLWNSDGIHRSSRMRERSAFSPNGPPFREGSINGDESDIRSDSSSLVFDDEPFDQYLNDANELLRHAKEFMRDGLEKERAEIVLYKCSKLLLKAIAMKPNNLLAVGLLGNTYLLHGELKLRISRELRTLLYRTNPSQVRKWGITCNQFDNKDGIETTLVDVCEECEELLIEAGRKYRLALSIDGNDVRALYNWGLALTFRAQLISDIGPEASFDADKVFLAAIDKFDAMMSKGNAYVPDALFRWGMVLQQRSRLRPSNSKEKVKLLNQAKSLFEDALEMNSNKVQVKEALSTCISELNNRNF